MTKYSIILRAYNAEEKISRSIESILGQSYTNWELLIVNDGSTDKTGDICKRYAARDTRIKVIEQENKGCLLSTLVGVKNSSGDFICLVDSDDWYEKEYIEKVHHIIDTYKVDMVVAGYHIIDQNGKKSEFKLVTKDEMTDARKAVTTFLETTNYALWNKFVAKKKIQYREEEQKFFEVSGTKTNFGDDLFLLMPVVCGCDKVYFLSECLYNYTIDNQSISHQKTKNQWVELQTRIRLMQFTYESITKRNYMSKEIEELIKIDTIGVIIDNILNIMEEKQKDKQAIYEIRKNKFYRTYIMKTRFSAIRKKLGTKYAMKFKKFNFFMLHLV